MKRCDILSQLISANRNTPLSTQLIPLTNENEVDDGADDRVEENCPEILHEHAVMKGVGGL